MGGWEALAGAPPSAALAAAFASEARRALLRRPGRHPGAHAAARIAERHQSARGELLPLAEEGLRHRCTHEEHEDALLPKPEAIQPNPRRRPGRDGRGRRIVLLPKPYRV